MANWNDPQPNRTGFGTSPSLNGEAIGRTGVDEGLRRHLLSIYNYMTSGVLLTGIVALLFARSGMAEAMFLSPLRIVVMLAPLGFVFAMSLGASRFSTATLQALFWAYCAVMGLSLSVIFLVYSASAIALSFFASAAAFAGMSLIGYTTKRDLSGMGSFMIMGLIGIIVASLLNALFLGSPSLSWAITYLTVVIFAGLTAWDTQRMKQEYYMYAGTEWAGKAVVLGALNLYLDFINMFLALLRIFGNRN
jgi:hypothetical protein